MQVSPYLRVANCSPATKPGLRGAEEAVLLHAQGRKPRGDPSAPHGQALQVGMWSGLKQELDISQGHKGHQTLDMGHRTSYLFRTLSKRQEDMAA